MIGTERIVPLRDVSDKMVMKEGKAILSADCTCGEYELFEWATGLRTSISLNEPRKMVENNEKDGMKGENMIEKSKEEINCGDAAVVIVGVRQMREGAEARKVEVTLSNCTVITRVHVFRSVLAQVFDAETQLTGLEEGSQAEVETAKVVRSFYTSDKSPSTEQEYIQRRQTAAERLGYALDAPSVLMHGVVTQETWRNEASAFSGDAICAGAASGEMMEDTMARRKKMMMMNVVIGEGMEAAQNWRRSVSDWKNINFLGVTTSVVLNEALYEGKRRRAVIPKEVIAGKGQSTVTVVATDDEYFVAKKLRLQLIDKKEEEKVFETVLRSGLDVGGFIEAEEEEERGRKSSVKGASGRAFNEGGDMGKMEVQVTTMQGKIIRVSVTKETTVAEQKELVQKKEGILPDMQKIIFNDVQLSDMRTMSGCFIRNNEELKLMPRLPGGAMDVQGQMGQMGQMEKGSRPGSRMAMPMVGMARAGAEAGLGQRPRI
ncbi:putative Ubiquitin family [Monocercomonoides exilis]|uniref:putative Ubiquitin family n=1 Tax=Monocercomonoides exilis TaxID=2049356 RepID=UPI00355AC816|nr:putative Ubiquitin family [Monocercomonoides exilis]|eukprot:MONOS_12744.1-p1 / transcript=MONOS_12744.1 / gene=MONOS_12744 / organism=Monocercomonoides_exilis_PA203 / gene_product=unspecified product / transcript_product=unspecified product / location=Mono_scaffold00727:22721-24556(-) / protein_length=488 / sequence_SO=supercontig / SO=protein_coding / is_pseudo=false